VDLWEDICNYRRTVVPGVIAIQGVNDSQKGSAIPRLGITKKGSDDQR